MPLWANCRECGAWANLNPYVDSPYYGLCFACQLREVGGGPGD